MIVYFDSSAFLKLLVEESGSDLAAELWDSADVVTSSRLAYPEVRAALAAALRSSRLRRNQHRQAESSWSQYWSAVHVVELSEAVASSAGELASSQGLRGADAVHLASVVALRDTALVLAAWDGRLARAAHALGIGVVPRPAS